MQKHPFIESAVRSIYIALLTTVGVILQSVLLYVYADMPYLYALIDSILTIGLLAVFGYLFWFVVDIIRIVQAKIILSVLIVAIWLGLCTLIQSVEHPAGMLSSQALKILPLRAFTGVAYWVILLQWYQIVKLHRWKEERIVNEVVNAPLPETIDRIAVKNGTRIHVIPVKDVSHVQACGDYIMLFTPAGEFLKEQTMKSLEEHLPSNFVRIHRSYIVNIEQIERVELFGKETYHVHLKNGTCVRASISGYKTLKEALAM